jgi:serine/threonine-protein kinase
MADVYLACTQGPRNFQKLLVVKLARFTGDPLFSTMFLEEARLAAQLSHPNVVQTYEIGEQGTRHYIVMEYLDGGVFSRLRQRASKISKGIPLRTSLSIMMQVLEGLEYAHEATGIDGRELKIVHRDLSPSNIMVTVQGAVKILDFGIARAADTQGFTLTGKFSGKLAYMPPEQLRGERVDSRADLFAAGVVIAEAAMNQKLWLHVSDHEIAAKLGSGQIPSLDREGIHVDPELQRICMKALAPERDHRYATAAELKADLGQYLDAIGGPIPQKELATFVKTTIEEDRAKLQTIIDSQLQRLSQQNLAWGGETPLPDLPRVDTPDSRSKSPVSVADATVKNLVVEENDSKQLTVSRPPSQRHTKVPFLLGGLVLAAGAAGAFLWSRGDNKPAAPPAVARLEIVASPSEAALFLDGQPLVVNPYVGTFMRDGKIHHLEIKAPGYKSMTQQFAIDRDLNFRLSLDREPVVQPPIVEPPTTTQPPPVAIVETPTSTSSSKKRNRVKVAKQPAVTKVVTPPVTAPPPVTTPPETKKSGLESDPYSKQTKRTLDSDVLDSGGSNKAKPTIDRGNPWQK